MLDTARRLARTAAEADVSAGAGVVARAPCDDGDQRPVRSRAWRPALKGHLLAGLQDGLESAEDFAPTAAGSARLVVSP